MRMWLLLITLRGSDMTCVKINTEGEFENWPPCGAIILHCGKKYFALNSSIVDDSGRILLNCISSGFTYDVICEYHDGVYAQFRAGVI